MIQDPTVNQLQHMILLSSASKINVDILKIKYKFFKVKITTKI